jgi:molybdate transport system substrate-binding protein
MSFTALNGGLHENAFAVELAGTLPAELQQELVFTAAVAADSKEAEAAKAFISFLSSPAATAVIKAKGMSPG